MAEQGSQSTQNDKKAQENPVKGDKKAQDDKKEADQSAGTITTTGIDSLLVYLKEHGETETNLLADALGTSERIVEEWSKILEKANIVVISYKVGRMFVNLMPASKEGIEELKQTIAIKKGDLETSINTQIFVLGQLGDKIDNLNKFIKGGEKVFKEKAKIAKDQLDKLAKIQKKTNEYQQKIKESQKYVNKFATDLDTQLREIQARALAIENFDIKSSNAKNVIDDISNKVNIAEQAVDSILPKLDGIVREQRKQTAKLVSMTKEELGTLRDFAQKQQRLLDEHVEVGKDYRREAEKLKIRLERNREEILDRVTKTRALVEDFSEASEKRVKEIEESLNAVKTHYGGLADISDKMNGIKDELEVAYKKKDEMSKMLSELLVQSRAQELITSESIGATTNKITKLGEKIANAKGAVKKLEGSVEKINRDAENIV